MILLWIFLTSCLNGFLSALAGSPKGEKHLRRFVIPVICSIMVYILGHKWSFALFPLVLILSYSMGHGIPSATDSGSSLGQFWSEIFPFKDKWINIATRATKGALKGIFCLLMGFITGTWFIFLPAFLLLIANNVIWGGDSIVKGEPIILGLNTEEFLIAFFDTAIVLGSFHTYITTLN